MKTSLLSLATVALLLSGCAPREVVVVHERHHRLPPPGRVEVVGVAPHPGARWVPGHWAERGRHWVWVPGQWVYPL